MGLDAAAALDRAWALDINSPTVRGLRGLYFQRTGNFREALTEFQVAAALEPENPMWRVSIGESQAKLGDLIRALEAYQTATTLAPDDAGYWRLLAIFCAQNSVNVRDIGVPAAQKAVVLAGEDAASLDVLGWLLTLDARHEEAQRTLERALELDPQNASAHLHLGMLHMQMNDRVAAYDHLIQARDLGDKEAEMILNQYFP
jgi:Flp pilus assembly protein TadD